MVIEEVLHGRDESESSIWYSSYRTHGGLADSLVLATEMTTVQVIGQAEGSSPGPNVLQKLLETNSSDFESGFGVARQQRRQLSMVAQPKSNFEGGVVQKRSALSDADWAGLSCSPALDVHLRSDLAHPCCQCNQRPRQCTLLILGRRPLRQLGLRYRKYADEQATTLHRGRQIGTLPKQRAAASPELASPHVVCAETYSMLPPLTLENCTPTTCAFD